MIYPGYDADYVPSNQNFIKTKVDLPRSLNN